MYNKNVKLICWSLGIFASFFYFGILQEKIMRGKYGSGESEERYTYALFLVLMQCTFSCISAKITSVTVMKQGEDTTPVSYHAACAAAYIVAMICSTTALKYVSYPTQVIAKSGKPLPVLLLGVLLGRKSYPLKKYLFVSMVVFGIVAFMYKDDKSNSDSSASFHGLGELLLCLSLLLDGVLGAIQERMRAEHSVRSTHLMMNMNLWAIIYVSVAVFVTGEIFAVISFIGRHPIVLWDITSISLAGSLGQTFIFLIVSEFGPLPCSIVTTTRKFFTILGSVLIYGNVLLPRQWIAAGVVFAGLGLDSLYGKSESKKK